MPDRSEKTTRGLLDSSGGQPQRQVAESDGFPRHLGRENRRGMQLVRGVGVLLLSIPVLLLLMCSGIYLFGSECPEMGDKARRPEHEYLSLYPVTKNASRTHTDGLLSNGTHMFRPTVIMVSIDGFRADYLDRGISPSLVHLGKQGLRADYMVPSFPSSTFPNHYTIATGLYPGTHGIVSNVFYDSQLNDTFVYKDMRKNTESKWWEGGEPIWVTAEKQGVKAGIDMWPGSTAVIRGHKPSYVIPYSDRVHPTEKTQQILEWLDMPLERRPAFLATYMPEVDSAAHSLGPDAKKVDEAIQMVDEALGDLWKAIEKRNLTKVVNLMVVSDHGMAASRAQTNAVYLDDIIDVRRLRGLYNWPLGGIEPFDESDVALFYEQLKAASRGQPWEVYLRKDLPERFHYTHKTRISPLYVVPQVPYYVTTRDNDKFHSGQLAMRATEGRVMGAHGYDNLHPLMRAMFVAVGPAFRDRSVRPPATHFAWANTTATTTLASDSEAQIERVHGGDKVSDMDAEQDYLDLVRSALVASEQHGQRYRAEYDGLWGDGGMDQRMVGNVRHPPFENVELYGLMARILGVEPAPNNGTAEFSRWWLRA